MAGPKKRQIIPVGSTPRKFLLKEARKMHKALNPSQKRLTSSRDIYHILRKNWREGNKVDREERQKETK